jgi:hypothetical protein
LGGGATGPPGFLWGGKVAPAYPVVGKTVR